MCEVYVTCERCLCACKVTCNQCMLVLVPESQFPLQVEQDQQTLILCQLIWIFKNAVQFFPSLKLTCWSNFQN